MPVISEQLTCAEKATFTAVRGSTVLRIETEGCTKSHEGWVTGMAHVRTPKQPQHDLQVLGDAAEPYPAQGFQTCERGWFD